MSDLISREALRKDFEERNKACDKWIAKAKDEETRIRAEATKHFICEVIMTIDNATAVDTSDAKYLDERDADAYETGYLQGHIDGYIKAEKDYAKPQGEWLKNANEIYKCSLCGSFGNPNFFRFCPNCGAEMNSKPSFYNTSGLTDEEEADRDAYEEAMRLDDEEGRGQA